MAGGEKSRTIEDCLWEAASAALTRYKEVCERFIHTDHIQYEKIERRIPVLRIPNHVITLHAATSQHPTLGVSANVHEPGLQIDTFASRIERVYATLDRMTVSEFYEMNRKGYGLSVNFAAVSRGRVLSTIFTVRQPYLALPQRDGKAGVVRLDFTVTPIGERILRKHPQVFSELVYGYAVRPFFAAYVDYLRSLTRPHEHER